MKRLAWVLVLVSCGARTDLGEAHDTDAGPSGTCSLAPPAPKSCTAWHAGTPQAIAKEGILGDATASGCGVLVAFHTMKNQSIAWSTRWVDYDGAMLAPSVAHPSLDAKTVSAEVSLAEGGMLEADETGCYFVPVDDGGHETGAVKGFDNLGCRALSRFGSKWSFLWGQDGGGGELIVFDDQSAAIHSLQLQPAQYVWDRTVFADGSFLVSAFWEDAQTAKYTNWLTWFDDEGMILHPSIAVPAFDSAPVLLARAGDHAMAAWQWTNVSALSVGENGTPSSPTAQVVSTDSPIYELALFSQPNGDVLFTWVVLDEQTNDFSLHARVIAPDGTPRGPATLLSNDVTSFQVRGAIESTGERALLAVTAKDGTIEALPLTCQ